MRDSQYVRNKVTELRSETGRALTGCALWLIAAYAGASSLMIGVMRLIYREGGTLSALTWMLAGGAVAAFAWHRAFRAVDRVEAVTSAQARLPATRSTSGLTTLVGAPAA